MKPKKKYELSMPRRDEAPKRSPSRPKPASKGKAQKRPARKAAARKPKPTPKKPARAPSKPTKAVRPGPARPRSLLPPKSAVLPEAKSPPPAPKGIAADVAARMAAFSDKVLREEEEGVAVRSWSEAKTGQPGSKELLPKTGEVRPKGGVNWEDLVEDEEAEDDDEAPRKDVFGEAEPEQKDEESEKDAEGEEEPEPRLEPLTGPQSVPKDVPTEPKFEVSRGKKGKKALPAPDFGVVELRQATATGGRHITRSKAENLQRAVDRIQALATPEKRKGKRPKASPEKFDVVSDAPPAGAGYKTPDLTDFGEVEIGQQTRSGKRKVGTLKAQDDEKDE